MVNRYAGYFRVRQQPSEPFERQLSKNALFYVKLTAIGATSAILAEAYIQFPTISSRVLVCALAANVLLWLSLDIRPGWVGSKQVSHLIWQLAGGVVVLAVVGKIATPSVEASIFDTQLRWAARGQPTQKKIEKAMWIVNQAKKNDVRVSRRVISQVGQKLLGSASQPYLQKAAVEAASQFASYQSSVQGLPLKVNHITTLLGTPTDPKGPPISIDVGRANVANGAEARSGNVFGFGSFTIGNCADLVLSPTKPEVLRLDTIDSKNATFVNFALIYNGGKLRLENVRFINCTFGVSDSTNLNVLKLLSAALSGQPINLELSDYEH
jgi:hypothetical protein